MGFVCHKKFKMNPRSQLSPFSNASLTIRQEIQRFESVHPSIYAIYDLIESIADQNIQQQIREHVVCIEGNLKPPVGLTLLAVTEA